MPLPTLVVVSSPPGSGKTTLAHQIARAVGCPAICRDEIKEGMMQATPGFVPRPGDELTARTLPVFFGVLELLLRAGVTTVAEAAFQDRVWRPDLSRSATAPSSASCTAPQAPTWPLSGRCRQAERPATPRSPGPWASERRGIRRRS